MPTRQQYRRECGYALDDLGLHTLTSSTSTTAVADTLNNATANASPLNYDDRYVFVATGSNSGQQVRVRPGGYAPSTSTLTVYPSWTSPSPAVIELTRWFPVAAAIGESVTYHTLLNDALQFIDVGGTIGPAVVASPSFDHPLTTWVAWITKDRINRLPDGSLDVREPAPVSGYPNVNNRVRQWEYIKDEDTPKLRTLAPFTAASGNLEAHVSRPASTWIKSGGTWAETAPTTALAAETDEALPEVKDVVDVFLMLAYRALMHRQTGAPSDPTMMKKFLDARDNARSVRGYNRTVERRAIPEMADLERAA